MSADSTVFERPWPKPDLSACRFYHSIGLPSGQTIAGDWDLRSKLSQYIGNVDVAGSRVLDMGAATGAVSFHLEQAGATVISADVASAIQYTKVPYFDDPCVVSPKKWLVQAESGLRAMKNSYWYLWHEFNSSCAVYYGDLINVSRDIGSFNVGFLGQILVHNRDPLGLLQAVASRTTETLIVSEGMDQRTDRNISFMPNVAAGVRPHGWFRFSVGALTEFIELMGFKVRSVTTEYYPNLVRKLETPITTIVADRKPNTMVANDGPAVVDRNLFPNKS